MGKSSSQREPNRGQFQGIGTEKAPRRHNNPNGTPRKMHIDIRPEQRGTPMEAFLRKYNKDLEGWANSPASNANGPFSAKAEAMPAGKIRDLWHDAGKASSGSKAGKAYMKKFDVSSAEAKKAIVGNPWVTFSFDPKSR